MHLPPSGIGGLISRKATTFRPLLYSSTCIRLLYPSLDELMEHNTAATRAEGQAYPDRRRSVKESYAEM